MAVERQISSQELGIHISPEIKGVELRVVNKVQFIAVRHKDRTIADSVSEKDISIIEEELYDRDEKTLVKAAKPEIIGFRTIKRVEGKISVNGQIHNIQGEPFEISGTTYIDGVIDGWYQGKSYQSYDRNHRKHTDFRQIFNSDNKATIKTRSGGVFDLKDEDTVIALQGQTLRG